MFQCKQGTIQVPVIHLFFNRFLFSPNIFEDFMNEIPQKVCIESPCPKMKFIPGRISRNVCLSQISSCLLHNSENIIKNFKFEMYLLL